MSVTDAGVVRSMASSNSMNSLPFAFAEDPEDLTGTRIKGGEEVECALADVLVLDDNWLIPRLRRTIARCPRSRLERRLFVERQDALVRAELARVQVADVVDGHSELIIARNLRAEPVMHSPRLELLRRENSLDRRR